jgi:hypothetical protein
MARKTPTAWLLVTYLIEKLTSVTEEPNERGKSGVQWLDWGLKRAKLLKNIEVNLGIKAGATSTLRDLNHFVILSGVVVSRSEAATESKNP